MKPLYITVLIVIFNFISTAVFASEEVKQKSNTQLVLLGTGNPNADPERFGPSVAVVVNDTPYLVDFGNPEPL